MKFPWQRQERSPQYRGSQTPRVGLPRALLTYRYYPLWKTFLQELPCTVVESPTTTKAILFDGVQETVDDLCIPVKAFIGHLLHLRQTGVDVLFVPRVVSVERSAKPRFSCPKFIGLPDMARALLGDDPIILDVDHHLRERPLRRSFLEMGRRLGYNRGRSLAAFAKAEAKQAEFEAALSEGVEFARAAGMRGRAAPAIDGTKQPATGPRIAVVAHDYLIFDDYLSFSLNGRLLALGARVIGHRSLPPAVIEAEMANYGEISWSYERELLGAVSHFFARSDVDGIVFLTSFACGTFAVVNELIERELRRGRDKPILYLMVDELSGEAGVQTRLESFCDMLGEEDGGMKAAFAHMGYIHLNLGAWVRHLGIELSLPPRPTARTLADGVRHSPEQMCIPFKANLGDLMAALDGGVDLLVSVQGAWSCRFGYYGRLHHAILRDLGYEFETLILDGSRENIRQVLRLIKQENGVRSTAAAMKIFVDAFRIAHRKGRLLARAQDRARRLRPREARPGSVNRLFDRIVARIDEAESHASLGLVERELDEAFADLDLAAGRPVVKIMMLGEVYIVLEPLANMNAERRLGAMGAVVDTFVNEHRWVMHPFRLGIHGRYRERHAHRLATPYLKHKLGGEDKNTLGYTIIAAERGFDGVLHFKPFTCMPEGVAKHILYAVSRDHGIPFMSFTVDEHSAEAGLITRLEAYTDMLRQRQERAGETLARAAAGLT